jgi:hypothetical protein
MAAYERYAQVAVPNSKDHVKRIEQEVSHSIGMFEVTSAAMTGLEHHAGAVRIFLFVCRAGLCKTGG